MPAQVQQLFWLQLLQHRKGALFLQQVTRVKVERYPEMSFAVDLKALRGPAGCPTSPTPTTTRATPPPSTNSEGVMLVHEICLFCLCE